MASVNVDEILEKSKERCVSRAQSALDAELAMARARHQGRLFPGEHLVRLEACRLVLEQAEAEFLQDDVDAGLQSAATAEKILDSLCWEMAQ